MIEFQDADPLDRVDFVAVLPSGLRSEPGVDATVDVRLDKGESLAIDVTAPADAVGDINQILLHMWSRAGLSPTFTMNVYVISGDQDADEDGYPFHLGCAAPSAETEYDCDDFDETVHPSAAEVGDGRDHDCDGTPD